MGEWPEWRPENSDSISDCSNEVDWGNAASAVSVQL